MGRSTASTVVVAICILVIGSGATAPRLWSSARAVSSAQALRTCVDRWNQDNMLGWGPTLANVSVRRLTQSEKEHVAVYDHLRRCTVSLAVSAPRDPKTGCFGYAPMPGHPKFCVSTRETYVCVINPAGGYWCSRYADGAPPLMNKNATTDGRGALTLDVPLTGTHPTPSLAWQRRYPHVDSFIHPWTSAGKLRQGLSFDRAGGASLSRQLLPRLGVRAARQVAFRCVSDVQFDPCYPRTADWDRRGTVVACADAGSTSFGRFVITRP